MSRKAITLKYQGTGSTLVYGPEIPYATQRAGVKASVQAVLNNSSGSGATAYYEIWLDHMVKKYHAKYKFVTTGDTWSPAHSGVKGGLD